MRGEAIDDDDVVIEEDDGMMTAPLGFVLTKTSRKRKRSALRSGV